MFVTVLSQAKHSCCSGKAPEAAAAARNDVGMVVRFFPLFLYRVLATAYAFLDSMGAAHQRTHNDSSIHPTLLV